MRTLITADQIRTLCVEVHADNVAAGWWNDLETGEDLHGRRNVGELLMLVVTELAEAADGWLGNLPDDKLTGRPMFEVELADAAIRIFDIAGGLNLDLRAAYETILRPVDTADPAPPAGGNLEVMGSLMAVTMTIARAMEGHRKGAVDSNTGLPVIAVELARTIRGIFYLGRKHNLDVMGAIEAKRAFNKNRADHKPENRRAAGGKKV